MDTIIGIPVGAVTTSLLAAGARFSLAKDEPNLLGLMSVAIVAVFLTSVSYPYIMEQEFSDGAKRLIVATVAFLARDLLDIILILKTQISQDPLGILRDFLNWRKKNDGD